MKLTNNKLRQMIVESLEAKLAGQQISEVELGDLVGQLRTILSSTAVAAAMEKINTIFQNQQSPAVQRRIVLYMLENVLGVDASWVQANISSVKTDMGSADGGEPAAPEDAGAPSKPADSDNLAQRGAFEDPESLEEMKMSLKNIIKEEIKNMARGK